MKKVHKLTLTALTAAVAMATGAAHASIIAPNSDVNNTGGSEVVLSIYDPVSLTSYSRDLGITFNGFNGAGSYSYNLAGDANFTAAFAGGLNSGMVWSLNAADTVVSGSTVPQAGARILTTVGDLAPTAGTNSNIIGAGGNFTNYWTAINTAGTHPTLADGSNYVVGTDPANFWSVLKNNWNNSTPFDSTGAVGSSLYFMLASETCGTGVFGVTCNTSSTDLYQFYGANGLTSGTGTGIGQWTLSQGGVLSYSAAVSAVPVPAAVWLFGSGLLGLVGIARRRVHHA